MASISPAPVIAQVITAKDPGGGFYTVYVRMPQHLISKFPDEAWGTPIEEIGLAAKEVVNFSGHVLVGVETIPRDDTGDLYWVFEKLDGPVWTTEAVGQDGLIPAKFRRQVEITTTKQDVTPDTNPTALTGDLVSSIVQRVEDSGKAVKLDTSETIDESATPLEGQIYGEIVTRDTSEVLVEEGTPADTGIEVISSTVTPLGNGKAVKTTEVVEGGVWPEPVDEVLSREKDNLIPAKFRNFILRLTQSRKVGSIPETITLTGDEVAKQYKRETPDRVNEEVTTEELDESATPLEGQIYGEIVTRDTSEVLVEEGTPADTGIEVISSTVTPLGNGKAVKTTEVVEGGVWPDPVDEERLVSKNQIPDRFRENVVATTTTKMVASPNVLLDSGEVRQSTKKITPDRYSQTTTSETTNSITLYSSETFGDFHGGVANVVESIVDNTATAEQGFSVLSSSVTAINSEISLKRTVTAATGNFAPISGVDYDAQLGISIPFTKTIFDSSNSPEYTPGDTINPIDKWRSVLKTGNASSIRSYLLSQHLTFSTRTNISLPDVLKSVTFQEVKSIVDGQSYASGSSWRASTESGVSVTGSFSYDIESGYSGPVAATQHVFYIEDANGFDVATSVGADPWPALYPQKHILSSIGSSLTLTFSEAGGEDSYAISEGGNSRPILVRETIPPTLHGPIPITVADEIINKLPKSNLDQAFDARIQSILDALEAIKDKLDPTDPAYFYYEQRIQQLEDSLNYVKDLDPEDYKASYSPKALPATVPPKVTSGAYLVDSNISAYGYGLYKVTATVAHIP